MYAEHLDITLRPKPEHQLNSIDRGSTVRLYESSAPGLVSLFMSGTVHDRARGLRLDRAQVAELRDALTAYLAAPLTSDEAVAALRARLAPLDA